VVVALILGLLASMVWSRSLRKQVALRTSALEREVEKRKRAAEELKLHQQQLVQADKMAALGVLVSGMAHEINNPNGLILLNLPTVTESAKDISPILDEHYRRNGDFRMGGLPYSQMKQEMPHLLNEMIDAARRIRRIVEDLKQFSRRSDASYDDLIDINEVVKTSVRLVDNSLRNATARYNVHYAGNLPKVRGNFQRLEQVVVNLILNSCQALPGPERGIFVSTLHNSESGEILIQVSDEGVGIPPEHLSRLTDPFFTTKRESGGTGLGLSISDGIIREHGGRMQFESIPGEGTTVIITLPEAGREGRA
jgi:polar amino acid transport system substrate-binding protein